MLKQLLDVLKYNSKIFPGEFVLVLLWSGCPQTNNTVRKCETKLNRFHGCMQHIFIDNEQLDIDIILQRQWGRYAELLLGTCGITDR